MKVCHAHTFRSAFARKRPFSRPFSSVAKDAHERARVFRLGFFRVERAECADCLRVAFLDTKRKWVFSHAKRTIARNYVSNARRGRVENRYDVPVAKSRCPFLESRTVVFLGRFSRCLVLQTVHASAFARMFWRGGSPRRASFYPTHAHARRRYVHARERSAYESLLSPTRVRRTSR